MAKAGRQTTVEGTIRPGWFGPAAAVLVLAGAAGAFMGYDALQQALPNPATGYGGLGGGVVALVLAALLTVSSKREIRVDLKGITVRAGMGKPTRIEWGEPHDYYYRSFTGESTPSVVAATVRTEDGRRIDIDDVTLPEHPNASLPALVEQYSTAANLPKIKERLEDDEEVPFGVVQLSKDSIQLGDKTHSLEHGIVLQIQKGNLRLGTEGKWFASKVSAKDVANYPCLLRVVGQIAKALPPS